MIGFALHIDRAKFPADPYGYDHANKTAELVDACGRAMGATDHQVKIVRAAAVLHDLGRTDTRQFWQAEPGHAARSAELAAGVLAADGNWIADREARDEVCRLIGRHQLDRPPPPSDLLACILWDADSLEAARFDVQAPAIRDLVLKRYSRLLTPWARSSEVQARWISRRSLPDNPTAVKGGSSYFKASDVQRMISESKHR